MSVPSSEQSGTAFNAPVLLLRKMLDQLFDEIFQPLSNSMAGAGKLKADQHFRTNGPHLPPHAEGHLVDAEDQFHHLIHDKIQRPLQCHQASVHAQVEDLAWNGPFIGGQQLDVSMSRTLKTLASAKFYLPARFLLCLRLFGWHQFFTFFSSLRVLISLRVFINPGVCVLGCDLREGQTNICSIPRGSVRSSKFSTSGCTIGTSAPQFLSICRPRKQYLPVLLDLRVSMASIRADLRVRSPASETLVLAAERYRTPPNLIGDSIKTDRCLRKS
jgi:hypothetical protein